MKKERDDVKGKDEEVDGARLTDTTPTFVLERSSSRADDHRSRRENMGLGVAVTLDHQSDSREREDMGEEGVEEDIELEKFVDGDKEEEEEEEEEKEEKEEGGKNSNKVIFGTVATIAVGAVGAVALAPLALGAAGFTSAGIAAGSIAAKMMSAAAIANGGGVAAGSLVAVLQSAGAAGLSGAATAVVAGAGGTVGWLASLFGRKSWKKND